MVICCDGIWEDDGMIRLLFEDGVTRRIYHLLFGEEFGRDVNTHLLNRGYRIS